MATKTPKKVRRTVYPVTAAGVTHPDILAALAYIRALEKLNTEDFHQQRVEDIEETRAAIEAILDGIRTAPVPEGQEQKIYTSDSYWGFDDVSHTYDFAGNKVRVGDQVTYLSGVTSWTIKNIRLNNDGTERITIERATGYRKSFVNAREIRKAGL